MWKIHLLFLFCLSTSGRIIIIERESKALINHPIKDVTNLNGLSMRIAYFEIGQLVKQGDSRTKITGVYGDIWSALGEYLNFTLILERLDKKQYPGSDEFTVLRQFLAEQKCDVVPHVSGAEDNKVDYTLQFYTVKEQTYVRPVLKINEKWLFTLVDYQIWFVLGAFLVAMAIVGWVADQFLVPKILRLTMGDQLFYNFSTLCLQDTQSDSFDNRFKMVSIARCVLVFMFWGYFSTFLYAQLTVKIHVEPFHNAQELLEKTDMKILTVGRFFHNGPLKWTLDHPVYKKRIEFSTGLQATFDKICLMDERKYAMITTDRAVASLDLQCDVRKTGEDISSIIFFGVVRKGFQYKRSIDIGILKLKESGLLHRVKHHWYPPVPRNKLSSSDSEPESFGWNHYKYVFGIWGLGMFLSFIVFVGEFIVWHLEEEKKEKERKIRLEREKNIQLYPFVL